MNKLFRLFYIIVVCMFLLINGCIINESDQKYNAQIAEAQAKESMTTIIETNETTRQYIDTMAKLATPNYTPFIVIGSLLIVGFVIVYVTNSWRYVEENKLLHQIHTNKPQYKILDEQGSQYRKIPQKIQYFADQYNAIVEYDDEIQGWHVYTDDGEIDRIFRLKRKQLTDSNSTRL